VFPLTAAQAILVDRVIPVENQQAAIDLAVARSRPGAAGQAALLVGPGQMITPLPNVQAELTATLTGTQTVHEFALAPLDGGPFSTRYEVVTSLLMIPKQIDLAAD
jgi:hypothetical protein